MSYKVELQNFEGPMDLLLYFIKRDELNIYDIPITHITREFMLVIKKWEEMKISIAGEFRVSFVLALKENPKITIFLSTKFL